MEESDRSATQSWPPPEFSPAKPDGTWLSPGYRSSWLRGRIVLGLLGLTIIANAIGAALSFAGFGIIDSAFAGALTDAEANAYDDLVALTALVGVGLLVATSIALLPWLSRVVENVPPLTGFTPQRSPREAIGWWFVPIASYVTPFQVVGDTIVRLRTSPDPGAERLVGPWWILYLGTVVATFLENVANSSMIASSGPGTPESFQGLFTVRLLSDLMWALDGVLLFLIILAVERRSEFRAAWLGLGRSSVATWPAASYEQPEPAQERGPAPDWTPPLRILEQVEVSPAGPTSPPPPPGRPAPLG